MSKGCTFTLLGESSSAILCGGKGDHECNEDLMYLLLDNDTVPMTKENQEKYQDQIRGGSVGCSICGRLAIHDAYKMEI